MILILSIRWTKRGFSYLCDRLNNCYYYEYSILKSFIFTLKQLQFYFTKIDIYLISNIPNPNDQITFLRNMRHLSHPIRVGGCWSIFLFIPPHILLYFFELLLSGKFRNLCKDFSMSLQFNYLNGLCGNVRESNTNSIFPLIHVKINISRSSLFFFFSSGNQTSRFHLDWNLAPPLIFSTCHVFLSAFCIIFLISRSSLKIGPNLVDAAVGSIAWRT